MVPSIHRVHECRSHILINLCSSTFQFSSVITLPNDRRSPEIEANSTLINKCVLWSNLHFFCSVLSSCVCVMLHMLSQGVYVSSYGSHFPCYLSAHYTHCPGTARRSFILHGFPTLLIYGAVTFLYDNTACRANTLAYCNCLAAGWHAVCVWLC